MMEEGPVIQDLPAIPVVARRVIDLASDENTDLKTLTGAIELDQGMVAKILRIANSSMYGLNRRVNTLDRAVVAVGFNTVRQLAMATSMHGTYEIFGEVEGRLWEHSVGGSIASFLTAKRMGIKQPDAAITAGLLHDIGKAVLRRQHPEDYAKVAEAVASGTRASEAEREIMGVTHSLMGARALKQWRLPDSLVFAVRFHHTPQKWSKPGDDQRLLLSVALGNIFCHLLGIGCRKEVDVHDKATKEALRHSGIAASDLLEVMEEVRNTHQKEKQLFA